MVVVVMEVEVAPMVEAVKTAPVALEMLSAASMSPVFQLKRSLSGTSKYKEFRINIAYGVVLDV